MTFRCISFCNLQWKFLCNILHSPLPKFRSILPTVHLLFLINLYKGSLLSGILIQFFQTLITYRYQPGIPVQWIILLLMLSHYCSTWGYSFHSPFLSPPRLSWSSRERSFISIYSQIIITVCYSLLNLSLVCHLKSCFILSLFLFPIWNVHCEWWWRETVFSTLHFFNFLLW